MKMIVMYSIKTIRSESLFIKESANYVCSELNKKYSAYSFYVVRCEHGDILR